MSSIPHVVGVIFLFQAMAKSTFRTLALLMQPTNLWCFPVASWLLFIDDKVAAADPCTAISYKLFFVLHLPARLRTHVVVVAVSPRMSFRRARQTLSVAHEPRLDHGEIYRAIVLGTEDDSKKTAQ